MGPATLLLPATLDSASALCSPLGSQVWLRLRSPRQTRTSHTRDVSSGLGIGVSLMFSVSFFILLAHRPLPQTLSRGHVANVIQRLPAPASSLQEFAASSIQKKKQMFSLISFPHCLPKAARWGPSLITQTGLVQLVFALPMATLWNSWSHPLENAPPPVCGFWERDSALVLSALPLPKALWGKTFSDEGWM